MSGRLRWERDGRDWPNRTASRFVCAAGLQWHVQQMGEGPGVLLVHGTGSATHSWRELAPLLARQFRVIAPELPGHGFTSAPPARGMSLPAMASALGDLLRTLGVQPAYTVGHSAGAAILARMCLDGVIAPRGLASLNGALLPMRGLAGALFSPFAKLLAAGPLLPGLFSWHVSHGNAVERLLEGTGSAIDADGVAHYRKLAGNSAHTAAVLDMMAQWDLPALAQDLPRLATPLLLLAGENDRAVPPSEAQRVQVLLPHALLSIVVHAGHLAHEERPHAVAEILAAHAREVGALA